MKLIVEKKGIDRDHLLKAVAEGLRNLKVCMDSEAQVIRLFNTVPFFDEVIMKGFSEYRSGLMNKDDVIADWLREDLGIAVNWEARLDVVNERGD